MSKPGFLTPKNHLDPFKKTVCVRWFPGRTTARRGSGTCATCGRRWRWSSRTRRWTASPSRSPPTASSPSPSTTGTSGSTPSAETGSPGCPGGDQDAKKGWHKGKTILPDRSNFRWGGPFFSFMICSNSNHGSPKYFYWLKFTTQMGYFNLYA